MTKPRPLLPTALLSLLVPLAPGVALAGAPAAAGYTVSVTPPAAAKVGQPASAAVRVVPGAGMHVNTEYPTSLTLKYPSGVEGPAGRLKPTRIDRSAAQFDVPLTAHKAGSATLAGTVSFVVCSDDNSSCVPRREPVSIVMSAR